jgi:hypothetical protein
MLIIIGGAIIMVMASGPAGHHQSHGIREDLTPGTTGLQFPTEFHLILKTGRAYVIYGHKV